MIHRRTIRTALTAAAVVAGCGDGGTQPPIEPPPLPADSVRWIPVQGAPVSPGFSRHDDVYFVDLLNGWLANTRGEIHRTTDGGVTWSMIHSDPNTRYRAIGFTSATAGWAGNINGFNAPANRNSLFKTTDGGVTWRNVTDQVQGPDPVGICGIWIASATHVYGVGRWSGPAVFVRTRDGGATWTSTSLASLATGLVDVYFFDQNTGIAVGGDGVGNSLAQQASSHTVVLRTEDGGDSWTRVYRSAAAGEWAWKISFPTADIGYVSVQGTSEAGIVLKSTDGGRSWTQLPAVDEQVGFSAIGFITPDSGWVAGDTLLYSTIDGGQSWRTAGKIVALNRIRFLPNGKGFGAANTILTFQR